MANDDLLLEWLDRVSNRLGASSASTKSAKSTVTFGKPTITKQVPLGPIRWGGRLRGKMWGLTDTNGSVVRGGASTQLRDMAKMNNLGERALQAIAGLEALDGKWRSEHDALRKTFERAESDLKKMEQALPAMRERNKNDDFHNDVDGYLVALEDAEKRVREIPKAEKDFLAASKKLDKAVNGLEFEGAKKDYEVAKQDYEKLQADIKEAKRIFGTVMGIAIQIGKQDWKGLATRALSHLGEKSIKAAYAPQLNQLKQELVAAKNEMARLSTAGLILEIEAARFALEAAAISLENRQHDLKTELERLARKQANASNELKESSSTAIAGQMISQRGKQLNAISTAQALCAQYLSDSAGVSKNMEQIAYEYALVGSWLDKAAKADSAFARSTPYGKMLEQSALSNSVELGDWGAWVEHVQDECAKARKWIIAPGAKGPMGPFDKAIILVKKGMKEAA